MNNWTSFIVWILILYCLCYLMHRIFKFYLFYNEVMLIIEMYSLYQKRDYDKRFFSELEYSIKNNTLSLLDGKSYSNFLKKFDLENQDRSEWFNREINFSNIFGFRRNQKIRLIMLTFRSFISDDMVNEILYDKIYLKQMIEYINDKRKIMLKDFSEVLKNET